MGAELEFVLPILKNKWAALVEPYFYSYKREEVYRLNQVALVEYNSLDIISIGLRHYFYLGDGGKHKLFLNALFVPSLNVGRSVMDFTSTVETRIKPAPTMGLGGGFQLFNRFSVEARYLLPRALNGNFGSWNSRLNSSSLLVGWKIF